MKHKPVLFFILRFFTVYILLIGLYQLYVSSYTDSGLDPITYNVSQHTVKTGQVFNLPISAIPHEVEKSMKVYYKDHYILRIVEGCNAVSVIILFVSFIVAFKGSLKNTLLFIVLGSLGIYLFNIFRILLLTIAIEKHPSYTDFLHQIIFPLIIYGFTFLLWIFWVKIVEKQHQL